jgi:hypothetical protein
VIKIDQLINLGAIEKRDAIEIISDRASGENLIF